MRAATFNPLFKRVSYLLNFFLLCTLTKSTCKFGKHFEGAVYFGLPYLNVLNCKEGSYFCRVFCYRCNIFLSIFFCLFYSRSAAR